MTIQMLAAWNGKEDDSIHTLDSVEESRLVSAGLARFYTPGMDGRSTTVSEVAQVVTVDPLTGAVSLNPDAEPLASIDSKVDRFKIIGSNTAVLIGDSIAVNNKWFELVCLLSGAKLRMVRNSGISGNNSNQMLARFSSDVIAYSPAYCVIEGVTPNDPGQLISTAQSISNVKQMAELCVSAGIMPVICSGPPSDTPANSTHMRLVSARVVSWAHKRGYPVLDLYTPVADLSDGTFTADKTVDGTHLSTLGARAIAEYNVARLPAIMSPLNMLQVAASDADNLLSNGLFLTDTDADGQSDSWSKLGGGTTSRTAVTAGYGYGMWQVVSPGGFATSVYQSVPTTVGNTYEVSMRVFVSGAARLRIRSPQGDFTGDHFDHGAIAESTGAIAAFRFVAIDATSQIQLGANGASGTVGYAQVTLRNMSVIEAD